MGQLSMVGALTLLTAVAVGPQALDTVIDLRPGDRVTIDNLSGDVSVVAWDRDLLEVLDEDGALRVERSGGIVRVVRAGRRRSIDARLRVPAWVDVDIGGPDLDISARGVQGDLEVRNVRGDVRVEDAGGSVAIRSIEGEIEVLDAAAGVTASSQSGDVWLTRVSGTVTAYSGDGDLTLEDVEAPSVRAETLDGDLSFSGGLLAGGSYEFSVHDGDMTLAVPEATSARVSVSTFDGEFEPEFPVVIERFTGGREFEFVMGGGSAQVRIEVFDGEIRLLRR